MEKKLIVSSKKYKGESVVVSTRLPSDLVDKIDSVCEITGKSRNELITKCLDFALDNMIIKNNEEGEN